MRETAPPGFTDRAGSLCAEGVPLARIAAAVGTPFYCYSTAALEGAYRRFADALAPLGAGIYYAVKANSNLAVIATLARLGAGADVVSEGELRQALAAGVPAEQIVFAGVGKTRDELAFALAAGIHQFNVESVPELETLDTVARGMGRRAPVALRVNPDVDAATHAKITTGRKGNKFGIDHDQIPGVLTRAAAMSGIDPVGLSMHIGSQLLDTSPFERAFPRLVGLALDARASGIPLARLDLGGGLGVRYSGSARADVGAYVAAAAAATRGLGFALAVEPGRYLVAEAGVLVSRVVYVKEGTDRRFLILDAAMNDLIRPALYDSWHEVVPVTAPPPGAAATPVDIVGPVCESGDTFARERLMPEVAPGDLVAFLGAGAYGAVMSSTYNSRLLVPEVLVRGGEYAVVRPRQTFEELLARDVVPGWLAAGGGSGRGAAG